MTLQERDVKILAFLLRYKYIFAELLYRQFFQGRSKTAMYKVIRRLKELGLIEQVSISRTAHFSFGHVCYLSKKGAEVLANEWQSTAKEIGYKKIVSPIQSINHIYHRFRLIQFWIKLDNELENLPLTLKTIATEGERIKRDNKQFVKTFICSQDGLHSLVPDMYFILQNEGTGKEALYFLEVDTGKETIGSRFKKVVPKNSLLYKYQTYETILQDGGWKNYIETSASAFQVLTVTEKQQHIKGVYNKAKPILRWSGLFFLSTHESVESQGVLSRNNWYSLKNLKPEILLK